MVDARDLGPHQDPSALADYDLAVTATGWPVQDIRIVEMEVKWVCRCRLRVAERRSDPKNTVDYLRTVRTCPAHDGVVADAALYAAIHEEDQRLGAVMGAITAVRLNAPIEVAWQTTRVGDARTVIVRTTGLLAQDATRIQGEVDTIFGSGVVTLEVL